MAYSSVMVKGGFAAGCCFKSSFKTATRPVQKSSSHASQSFRTSVLIEARPSSAQTGKPDAEHYRLRRRHMLGCTLLTALGAVDKASALGPLDFGKETYNDAAEATRWNALIALLDGQDALVSARRIKGAEGGYRIRLRNLLARHTGTVQTMTAYLPAVVEAIPGEASRDQADARVAATGDILVGASTVVQMAKFAKEGEFDSYKVSSSMGILVPTCALRFAMKMRLLADGNEVVGGIGLAWQDEDIPFDDIDKAIQSIGVLMAQVPQDTLIIAQKERCRREINKARDFEEMREVANSPAGAARSCAGVPHARAALDGQSGRECWHRESALRWVSWYSQISGRPQLLPLGRTLRSVVNRDEALRPGPNVQGVASLKTRTMSTMPF
eukprot:1192840-Prorocentrum_minimum.AAC.4